MPILYGVSPIGLGHASRAVAVGMKLREAGLDLEFATGGPAVPFLRSYGFRVHDIVTEPVPSEREGVMRYPSLWYINYWRGYRSSKSRMFSLMRELKPSLVVGDEEFSSVSLALEQGLKPVLISDELELGFARSVFSRYIERRVIVWYRNLQRDVPHLLIPDFGSDHDNVHFVGSVVRPVTQDRADVLRSLGMEQGCRLILLSASGSGIGDFLLDPTVAAVKSLGDPSAKLVVAGLPGRPSNERVRFLGLYRDNQNLVAAADLVISTAGKSTIDEAVSFGTPIIALPIKNHFEQEQNAASLGFTYDDKSRLVELLPKFLGKKSAPRNYDGAGSIARYLQKIA